ncbi:MAG: zinc ribbon domain-containing protein [Treponema sp.]|nr:zinc ribbon domain-containing protein [Treponema sp.]
MKHLRFFCENCGAQVSRDAKSCPHCGASFASVRCSSCGFTGAEVLFRNGCPLCGYRPPPARGGQDLPLPSFPRGRTAGSLPVWVYILTGIVLMMAGAMVFLTLR